MRIDELTSVAIPTPNGVVITQNGVSIVLSPRALGKLIEHCGAFAVCPQCGIEITLEAEGEPEES